MSSYNEAMKLYAQAPVGGLKKKGKKDKPLRKTYHMIKAEQNANQLEVLFEVQRRENEAAKTIQTAWRRTRILLPWRNAVRMMMAIVTIQRRARGMIARNLVAKWFYMRNSFATEIQARTRRQLSNLKVRPILAMERAMAIRIQRIARGKLARKRAVAELRDLAATRIQALWRGCVDRSRADREWLNKAIISVQNAARRKLALNRYQAEKDRLTRAAVVIQRKFRSYQAAIAIGDKLVARELKYRHECIKMLVAEAELCNEKIARIMDRAVKSQVKEKAIAAQQALQAQERVVYGMENDLSELIHQRQTLSPRAIEQGFDEELDKNIAEYRIKLTQSKLHCLFDLQREMHHADRNLEHQVAELEEWASNRNRMEKWCAQEYDDRRHVTYQRDITARRKAQQRAIAEERRLWQVLYYTRDGKPDKKRRPGKPWDPSVYAGAERATYCGANVDLLAFVRQQAPAAAAAAAKQQQLLGKQKSKKNSKQKLKTKKKSTGIGIGEDGDKDLAQSVQTTVEQVSLQTFLDEVKVYQELLDPIQSILEKNTGLAPDSRPPEELGWGPEGAELAEALATVRGEPQKAKRFGVGRTAAVTPASRGSGSRSTSRPSSPSGRSVASSSSSTAAALRQRGGFQSIGFSDDATVASGRSRLGGAASLGSVDARAAGFEPSSRGAQSQSPSLSRQPSQRLSRQPSGLDGSPDAADASRRPRDTRPMSPPPPALGRRAASGGGLGKQVSFHDMFAHGSSDESAAGHSAAKGNVNTDADGDGLDDDGGDENLLGTAAALLLQRTRTKKLSRPSRFHKKPPKTFLPADDAFDDRVIFAGRRPRREATSTASVAFGDNGGGADTADDVSSRRGGSVEELDELPLRSFRRRADAATATAASSSSSALSVASSKASSKALSMRDHEAKLLSRSLPASREVLVPSSSSSALSLSATSAALPPVVLRSNSNVTTTTGDSGPLLAPRNLHSDEDFGSATSLAAMMANVVPPSMETQEADHQRAVQLHAQRRSKKANQRRLGIIPWELLDEVDGMRHRFENEKRYVEFNKKF